MKLNPELKSELRHVVWDYAIDETRLSSIFSGKSSTFSLNRDKLFARLLISMKWYKLLDCVGVDGLKEMLSDDVIKHIWIPELRERFKYAQKILNDRA